MSLRPTGIGATPTRESPSRDGGPGSMLLILICKVPWIPLLSCDDFKGTLTSLGWTSDSAGPGRRATRREPDSEARPGADSARGPLGLGEVCAGRAPPGDWAWAAG